uniref:Uncharacterized protein n=1 Tax=Tanacetum cinerariifolium TaxID=118510 RepID=A0A699IRX0_TANCI|nr:hypothetical protein [Tanacetum cinerariifolium]
MERFQNAIFKQREEINDRMAEMFKLLKELKTSRAPKKVLIREYAKSLVTKNVNSISLANREEERNDNDGIAADGGINKTDTEILVKEAEKKNKAEDGTKNEPIRRTENEEAVEVPSSQPVGYYLKLMINEKLIKGFVDNHKFNDSVSGVRVGKLKGKTYNLSPRGLSKGVIKFDKGTITLRYGKSKISFYRIPESLCKTREGIKNDIEPIAPTLTVNRLVLEWEEWIRLHQEKEMEFDQ